MDLIKAHGWLSAAFQEMSHPSLLNQVIIEDWAGEKGRNRAKEGKCALPISAQTGVCYQIGHGF